MKYYKNINNEVYAFELDGSQDNYIPSSLIAITEQEALLLLTPPSKTQFTSLEFLERFTQSEQLAVVSATLVSAQLKLWYDMMLAASYVDLTDQRTIDGLSALVSAGLLTEQRKNEILG